MRLENIYEDDREVYKKKLLKYNITNVSLFAIIVFAVNLILIFEHLVINNGGIKDLYFGFTAIIAVLSLIFLFFINKVINKYYFERVFITFFILFTISWFTFLATFNLCNGKDYMVFLLGLLFVLIFYRTFYRIYIYYVLYCIILSNIYFVILNSGKVSYDSMIPFYIFGGIALVLAIKIEKQRVENDNLTKKMKNRNKVLHDKIKDLEIYDNLTGLYNNTYFEERFEDEVMTSVRYKNNFVFAFFDIDNFKKYTRIYGNKKRDEVLVSLAEILKSSFSRSNDNLFRISGEKFALFTICEDYTNLIIHFNKVIKKLRELKIEHTANGNFSHVTCSIGVILVKNGKISDKDVIYDTAEYNLSQAREEGRNKVFYSMK